MSTLSDVACVVVLYNPDESLKNNIESYINQVDKLYLVDNSERINPEWILQIIANDKVSYTRNETNIGIASALNFGAKQASRYKWLLTMDQDTVLPEGYVSKLLTFDTLQTTTGIICPVYSNTRFNRKKRAEEVPFAMTSGNLLNISIYNKIGPFLNELFIDHVDHEYCLRLRVNGFKILRVNEVILDHKPGTPVRISILGFRIYLSIHSPLREYYYCRNGIYVGRIYSSAYPQFRFYFYKQLVKELIKMLLMPNRKYYLSLLWLAIQDGRNHKLGKLFG
jgi:rhamnosyltransferase